ncbi:hypothetical protein [Xenorhabdus bovienii]|uniref:Uncharacterized protein n=2 Tax=Xenorhabdus bovienii TaxID=40576 RepID=A0A077NN45_XENBV|nr:hypothetical protein [Xenorhabdus bovienii]CDG99833.1 hypothetical protein XBFM1_1210023 [Xenorhabdus bovienii str. feltiae Moldova]
MFILPNMPCFPDTSDITNITESELNELKKTLTRDNYPKLEIGYMVILLNGDVGVVEDIFHDGTYDCRMERTEKLHMLPPTGMYITPTRYKGYSLDWDKTIEANRENNNV